MNGPTTIAAVLVVAGCAAFLLAQLDGWLDRRHPIDPWYERMRRALRDLEKENRRGK